MQVVLSNPKRVQSQGEEIANSISHGMGVIAALVGTPILIAGTYTPLTLGILRGAYGWALFGIVWGLAIAGVVLKAFYQTAHPILSTCLYLLMGWLLVIAVKPLFASMPTAGLYLLIAGGLSYTAGVAFFATDSRAPYGHLIWHLFVITGTTCHYFVVLWYAA